MSEPSETRREGLAALRVPIAAGIVGLALGLGLGFAIAGDSSGSETTSSARSPTSPDAILTKVDRGREPSGSPGRAFLEHWASLQFGAWDDAVGTYEDGLANFIGESRLQAALRNQGAFYSTVEPDIREKREGRRGEASVRYLLKDPAGKTRAQSVTLVRQDGRWQILFDSFLDEVLVAHAEAAAQQTIDPTATKPSTQAARAGARASRLQSRYRERRSN